MTNCFYYTLSDEIYAEDMSGRREGINMLMCTLLVCINTK